jgi:multidrug efflux pump subunit AcrA (membrane-fusion protein)
MSWIKYGILIVVMMVVGWFGWQILHAQKQAEGSPHTANDSLKHQADPNEKPMLDQITLTPEKRRNLRIKTATVELTEKGRTCQIPGHVAYDQTKRVEVRLPVPGMLKQILVKPGDLVTKDQIIAYYDAPEVGLARADVLKYQAQLRIATSKRDWNASIVTGFKSLIEGLTNELSHEALEQNMQGMKLGQYREKVLVAFQKYQLAQSLYQNLKRLQDSGTIPFSTIQQKESEYQSARSAFQAILEQSSNDISILMKESVDDVENAQRLCSISEQNLQSMLGYKDTVSLPEATNQHLSEVEIKAAIAGSVEELRFSAGERVSGGEIMLVLADTSHLWIEADVRDAQWQTLSLSHDSQFIVTSPALPGWSIQAKFVFLGRQVDPVTHALPLVMSIDNTKGTMRPGQYVQVSLPLEQPREMLTIPSSAVAVHEGCDFVFIPHDNGVYQRVNVTVGIKQENWVEIIQGLSAGQQVVASDVFALKSELLLEQGEE